MKHRTPPLFAAALFAIAGTASSAEIDVMMQNQYLGTDLTPVITSPPELISQYEKRDSISEQRGRYHVREFIDR